MTELDGGRSAWWDRVDQQKTMTLFLVALGGSYGLMVASMLPSLVSAWVAHLGLTEKVAGEIATGNVLAATVGLGLSVFLVRRASLPVIARCGLALAVIGDLASIGASGALDLGIYRIVAGLGLGLIAGATTNWFGRHEQAERGFGMYVMLQFILTALLLVAIPLIEPVFGYASVYVALLSLALLTALLHQLLGLNGGSEPLKDIAGADVATEQAAGHSTFMKLLSIFAFGLFNLAAIGLWSYMLRYGVLVGLSDEGASRALALSSLCGIPGTVLVVALGNRYGRFRPLMIALLLYALPIALFARSNVSAWVFVGGLALQNVAWAVISPYFQAVQAALDRTGRLAVWGLFAASAGAGIGPALLGTAIDGTSYILAFGVALGALVLSALLVVFPALATDWRDRDGAQSG